MKIIAYLLAITINVYTIYYVTNLFASDLFKHYLKLIAIPPDTYKPRLYPDFNYNQTSYNLDYNKLQIKYGRQADYELILKIGRGRFSEVYQAIHIPSDTKVVVKVLKPVKRNRITKEIKILQLLSGGPNIIKLLDLVRDPVSKAPSLVFEYIENQDFRTLFAQFNDFDIRYYTYKIFEALNYAHSKGIFHRDLKPYNIIINHEKLELRVIDWGLADYYFPGKEYGNSVGTLHYQPPESFTDNLMYHHSFDSWSTGCILAGLVIF